MNTIINTKETSPYIPRSNWSSVQLPFSVDCSPFLNWDECLLESLDEQAVVYLSLVATVKFQPALNDSLEVKAVKCLESVSPLGEDSADAFLGSFASSPDDSLATFVQSIAVLLSTSSHAIVTTTMKLLKTLVMNCSAKVHLTLVNADLIHQIISTINPLSLSVTEAVDIHVYLLKIVRDTLWIVTPGGLPQLKIEDEKEQQAVHESVLQQVVAPCEKYIRHLCVNRYSIMDGVLSCEFMDLLATFLEICPYYQPTMEFVLVLPVFSTIPSCLAFFEHDRSIWAFLADMNSVQREWNRGRGGERQMGKKVHRMLRMEGIDDVMEQKRLNDHNEVGGQLIAANSIDWSNLQGMNL
ncbi:hypothetical protein BLNAU_4808 [Blattamonas nauphoetae]|uniref:Uncharacterized protein n=1 Tax=Blattamonas nauphoetae TaxID=2049346 RepID=A0ABQ9Y949_9EUKA|nr:hypothetical protein BLNAU_4808 [Blattamonas nauphoetae]